MENEVRECYDRFTSCNKEVSAWIKKMYSIIENFSKKHLQSPAQKNMTAFCTEISRHLQDESFLNSSTALLKTYFTNPSDIHHGLLTAVVFQIQKNILSKLVSSESQTSASTLPKKAEPSSSGLGKIRYIGGYCVAKVKSEVSKKLSSCMFVFKKKNEFDKCKLTFNIVESMEVDYNLLADTTKYPETLEETQRKQNVGGGLTHISDTAYDFFVLLEKLCRNELNDTTLAQYGGNLFQHIYTGMSCNEELDHYWNNIFENVGKKSDSILTELTEKISKDF